MNEGCWMELEWKDGETNRFWFATGRAAEQFRRRRFLTPTGRLVKGLSRLSIIPDPEPKR